MLKFRKVEYNNRDTFEKNLNVSKRVEYFLHYWNFLFQKNSGLLFIHHEKLESHRSLIHKIEVQINENKSKYAKRIESLFIGHPYFQEDNLIIRKSPKAKSEINNFKSNFNTTCFTGGINDRTNQRNQPTIKIEFEKIKKLVLRNYLNRLLKALIVQLVTDKPINKTFKKNIQFLINAAIVELYYNGFSIDYIRKIADIIVFPKEHKKQFPYEKTFQDFGNQEAFAVYKEQTLKTINLHEQIACIKNFVDDEKHPKQKGFCVFKIDDFDFQLEEPVTIWDVTFYNPQKTKKVKTRIPGNESIEVDFNHLFFPKPNNLIDTTCNALIKVDSRIFNWDNPVVSIHLVINKIDKALQVLKKIKHDFVNGNGSVLGRVSTSKCIFLDKEFNYIGPIIIQNDDSAFKIEEYQKSVFADELSDINRLYYFKNKKLIDLYAYLCQAATDEFAFNFKDFWTVIAEANHPSDHRGFIRECQDVFKNGIVQRLFIDTKVFLQRSLCTGSISCPESEYLLKLNHTKQIGLNIPKKRRFNARKFETNYHKIKKYLDLEFLNDIVEELELCQTDFQNYSEKIDTWLKDTIYSAYAERNLETHNNIVTDYSLIKLKQNFLYIGKIYFLHCKKN